MVAGYVGNLLHDLSELILNGLHLWGFFQERICVANHFASICLTESSLASLRYLMHAGRSKFFGDLNMSGNQIHRSIVVEDDFVNVFDPFDRFGGLPDPLYYILAGRFPEERGYRLPAMVNAQVQQPCRYKGADVTVQLRTMIMVARYQTSYHGKGNHRLNSVVEGIDQNGMGVNPFSEIASELPNPLLYENGGKEYPRQGRPIVDGMGFENLMNRSLADLYPGNKEEHRHDEGSHMFHPTVSEGCFCCGRPGRHPETDHQNNGVSKVGKEMKSIRHDRYRSGLQSKDHFHDEQRECGNDGKPPGEQPMSNPDPFVVSIVEVLYEPLAESPVGRFEDFHPQPSFHGAGRLIPLKN